MRRRARADFAYGNARLRSRKRDLLSVEDLTRLVGKDVEGLLAALDATPYRSDVQLALTRHHGSRRMHEAIRLHLARSLEQMRGFYDGCARELVDLLLSRFDVQNVLAVLRAQLGSARCGEQAMLAVVPMGWLSDPVAREILRQQEPARAVTLLCRWSPDPGQAAALRTGYDEYERSHDLAALDRSILADHYARLAAALERTGRDGQTLRRFVRETVDDTNLLTALRLRGALERGEVAQLALDGHLMPGGSVTAAQLASAALGPASASDLAGLEGRRWQGPLDRWATTGDVPSLELQLEQARASGATRLLSHGDPLSIDVPLAFSVALESEARQLRLLTEAAVRGTEPDHVRHALFQPVSR